MKTDHHKDTNLRHKGTKGIEYPPKLSRFFSFLTLFRVFVPHFVPLCSDSFARIGIHQQADKERSAFHMRETVASASIRARNQWSSHRDASASE
jgi:hypothetical protein